jgi:hypothetical protein
MSESSAEILMVSRQLKTQERSDLLAWVNLAYVAESSVRKSAGLSGLSDTNHQQTQEYSCAKSTERSEQ